MRSVVLAFIVIVGLLGAGLFAASTPRNSVALGATPPDATPAATPGAEPAELCSDAQLALGETVFRAPSGKEAGTVLPAGLGTNKLFLVVMTLPPGSCIGWRERDGGVILFVQEGIIDYTAHYTDSASYLEVLTGDSDDPDCAPTAPGCTTSKVVNSDTTVTLHANEWVTQDRKLWYTFRNGGAEDAVVAIASYVQPWLGADPCSGNCRQP